MFRLLEEVTNTTETTASGSPDKPWGDAIGAALIVQAATFSGLLVVGLGSCWEHFGRRVRGASPPGKQQQQLSPVWRCALEILIPSFAAGALLATAVFMIIPEALELLSKGQAHDEHEDHAAVQNTTVEESASDHLTAEGHAEHDSGPAWKFGAALIGGFLFPILLGALFPSAHEQRPMELLDGCDKKQDEVTDQDEVLVDPDHCDPEGMAKEGKDEPLNVKPRRQWIKNIPLAAGILLGDMLHNLADGLFLGTGFLLCTKSLAWTIVAATVYHELAQEIADYFLLTHQCGLSMVHALALNFASGSSIVIGVIIVFTSDLGDTAIGAILSFSAGVYLYIAIGECLPRIQLARKTARDNLLFFLFFILGAVPIGLVLMKHVHCEATESSASTSTEDQLTGEHDHEHFLI
jgi:zinc transporter ZupT